jgi:hypothetical protein
LSIGTVSEGFIIKRVARALEPAPPEYVTLSLAIGSERPHTGEARGFAATGVD